MSRTTSRRRSRPVAVQQQPQERTNLKPFFVVQADRIVYQCSQIGEGLAFLAGRQDGVLCRTLCYAQHTEPVPLSQLRAAAKAGRNANGGR